LTSMDIGGTMARILIIDDNETMRLMIAECLQENHEILTAEDGQAGAEIALTYKPDLVICDLAMPNVNGFDVLRYFQRMEELAETPFIFLSGSADSPTVRQGMSLGADDFLLKPFSVIELLNVVKIQLEKRVRRQALTVKAIDELRLNITTALPHELRTSIMVIEGYAHLLLDDLPKINADHQNMIEAIQDNAERLRHMSEKYLWYLKVQMSDSRHMNNRHLQIDQTVRSTACAVAERMSRQSDLMLFLHPFRTSIDQEYFTKIIEEIVENGFKFSKSGMPVTVFGGQHADTYIICVTNSGPEFTPQQIERIGGFVQFERQVYEQQGTGLGLIIAKRLTEVCGGQLQIASIRSRTSISIVLPSVSA
jgi:two-component system, sensor histidine kinase and response regulator